MKRTLTALAVVAGLVLAVVWSTKAVVIERQYSGRVITNVGTLSSAATVSNVTIASGGYIKRIVWEMPAGLTSCIFRLVDWFGTVRYTSSAIIGSSNAITYTSVDILGTNLVHGYLSMTSSNAFSYTNALAGAVAPSNVVLHILDEQ